MSSQLRGELPENLRPLLRDEYMRNRKRFLLLVNETVVLRAIAGLPLNGSTRKALIAELLTAMPSPERAA
jgi:hypothetical protein